MVFSPPSVTRIWDPVFHFPNNSIIGKFVSFIIGYLESNIDFLLNGSKFFLLELMSDSVGEVSIEGKGC